MRAIFAEDWRTEQFRAVALDALVTSKRPFVDLLASTTFRMDTWPEKSKLSPVGTITLSPDGKAKRFFVVDVVSDPQAYRMTLSLQEVRNGQFAKPAECPRDTDASVTIRYEIANATKKKPVTVAALCVEEWPGMTFDVAITTIFMAVIKIVASLHKLYYDVYLHNTSYQFFYKRIPSMLVHDDEPKRRYYDGIPGHWKCCRIQWMNLTAKRDITNDELSLKVPLENSSGHGTLVFHGPARNLFLGMQEDRAEARAKVVATQKENAAKARAANLVAAKAKVTPGTAVTVTGAGASTSEQLGVTKAMTVAIEELTHEGDANRFPFVE